MLQLPQHNNTNRYQHNYMYILNHLLDIPDFRPSIVDVSCIAVPQCVVLKGADHPWLNAVYLSV